MYYSPYIQHYYFTEFLEKSSLRKSLLPLMNTFFEIPDLKPRNCQIYTKVVPAKSSCVGLTMQI